MAVFTFDKNCGGCHRLLTPREGALGSGDVAPNLSGLLTPFGTLKSD